MPVGNDVVDLGAAESLPSAIHSRWDSRVFGEAELLRLSEAGSPHRMRWTLWAAKEAAFKAGVQVEPGLSFIPREFAVRMQGVGRAVVDHVLGRFEVTLEEAAEWIHAVAVLPSPDADSRGVVERVVRSFRRAAGEGASRHTAVPDPREMSTGVRALAAESIARVLRLDPTSVEVPEDRGIPTARWRGGKLPLDLSLSHHGRFLACAWRPGAALGDLP